MENIPSLDSPEVKALVDKFSPYLAELKKRIIFTVVFFIGTTVFGFVFYERIIKFLVSLLSLDGVNIVFTSPFQFINLAIACGVATGTVLSLPLIVFQILRFLRPALRRKEFKTITRFMPFSFILFVIGFTFGMAIMKWQISIFLERAINIGIGNVLDISNLLTTVLLTSVLMGIGFQFPIVLILLMRIGVIKSEQLSRRRMWVYLGSFIFAMLLPPDSILADILLTLPLIIMFEVAIMYGRVNKRKR